METAHSCDDDNKEAKVINGKPLTAMETTKLLNRAPSKRIKSTVGMPTLSKDEASAIIKSKKGNKKRQESILRDIKSFFKAVLAGPALEHCLSRTNNESKNEIARFTWFFRGGKSDGKLNEMRTALHCFALRVKKMKPRKKGKGKNRERQCGSGSLSAVLKLVFTHFRSHGAKHALKDFNQSGGFTAAIEHKWKEFSSAGAALGAGCCAAACDRNGDEKM